MTFLISIIYFSLFSFLYSNDLQFYLELSEKNNPKLQKYKQDYLFFQEKPDEVSALPDPVVGFGKSISSVETKFGPQKAKISISQKIPWFGTLKTKREIALEIAKLKLSIFEDSKNSLFFQVKSKWYEIYENEKLIEITEKNIKIFQSYESLLIAKYENAKASLVDVLKIQIEIEKLKTDFEFYIDKKKNLVYDFNLLIGKDETDKIIVPKKIELSKFKDLNKDSKNTLLKKSPVYLAANFKLKATEYEKKLANITTYPDLGIGLDYIIIGESKIAPSTTFLDYINKSDLRNNSGRDAMIPMFNISIPINWKKNQSRRKQSSYKYQSVKKEKQDLLNQLKSNYNNVHFQYKDSERKVKLYQKEIELSQKALEILLVKYTTSNQKFEDILKIQQTILKYQILYEKAYKNQNTFVSKLTYLIGGTNEL